MSLKSSFLLSSLCLATTATVVGGYFSIKNVIFKSSWSGKFSNLEYKITQLSDEDYLDNENSIAFTSVKNSVQEIVEKLEKSVGKERFDTLFLKALQHKNLISNFPKTSSSDSFKYPSSDLTNAESSIKDLEAKIEESEKDFYKQAQKLNEICQKIIKKFENIKALKKISAI